MNVVIYAQFSSHSQTEQTIEGQLNVCHEYARSHGFIVIKEYIDRAQSGTSDNRSNFQQMINDSAHHAFQGILVYQLDRDKCLSNGSNSGLGFKVDKDRQFYVDPKEAADDGLFYRVQDILERNKVAPACARGKNEYLLATKLFCGHCVEMMTGYTGISKQGTRYHYYICNGRKAKRCNKKMISKSTIEESVINICLGLLTEEKLKSYLTVF